MLHRIKDTWRYLWLLGRLNLRAAVPSQRMFIFMAAMMFINNLLFFIIWIIYFANFEQMNGWELKDMATLMGTVAFGFGLAVALFGGGRNLSRIVMFGELDKYLGRPRHPLPAVLMSESLPSGVGDMISAFIFWFVLGGYGVTDLPLLLLNAFLVAAIIISTIVLVHSLVFWARGTDKFSDQMYEFFLMLSTFPQHGFELALKVVLFTVIPAGFVGLLPVEIMRDFTPFKLGALVAGSALYVLLAIGVFNMGLKKYTSSSNMAA